MDELKVLIVEDVPTDAELCVRELMRSGLRVSTQRVDTREAFEKALQEFEPELILSDFSLPTAFDGMHALEITRSRSESLPFIFVSGTIGEDRAVEAMRRGATDYVLKDRLNRLVPVVRRALDEAREREARRKAERELEETRDRLDSVVTSLADVVWSILASPYKLVYINQAAETVYRHAASEFYADPDLRLKLLHPDDREQVQRLWDNTLRGEVFDAEYRIVCPDGELRWVHDRGKPVRDVQGRVVRIDGLARDVTTRKLQQERITRLSRIHMVLSGINSLIVRVRERASLFREACRIAAEDGGFKLAWIGILDRETQDVKPLECAGNETGMLSDIRASARDDVPEGQGVVGTAVRSRKPLFVNDIGNDPRVLLRARFVERGFKAVAILPLVVEDEVVGVFALYSGETGVFDEVEMKLLIELAGDISFALQYIAKEERLDYLAYYDVLTGLPNRALFQERVNQLTHSAQLDGGKVALLALDVQRFGVINRTLGRQAGDAVLRQIAERLTDVLRDTGQPARVSADVFGIVLTVVGDETSIARIVEDRVLRVLSQPFVVQGQELRISVKCGIALFPSDGSDAETLFGNAEAALKNVKGSGEKYLFFESQMNVRISKKLNLENRLRIALLNEQFVLHYQPKANIASRRVVGLEALIRWRDPESGMVPPAEFIPILEETGMILEVGEWVIKQAVSDYRRWTQKGLRPPRIAVNVSAIELRQREFSGNIVKALRSDGVPVAAIDLEITESTIMENIEETIPKLEKLKAAGVNVAIDDFGTGYSSLSYIAKLPVNALKIDRTFVYDMTTNAENLAIVSMIISLAHSLNLMVTAEGVETHEQLKLLQSLKCNEMQGYLFGKPQPAADVEAIFGG